MKNLNVTFIVPYFYPVRGGTENNCLHMALETQKLGHNVRVITSDRKGKKIFSRKLDEYKGVKIQRLRRTLFSQYYLTFLPALPWTLLRSKADIIHTHIPGIIWTDFSVFLKKLFHRGTIAINTPHDPFMSRDQYSFVTKLMKKLADPIVRWYYPRLYDYVIAVNTDQYLWLQNKYGVDKKKIIKVLNGIDEEMFNNTPLEESLSSTYNLSGKIIITSVARFHEYKGHQNVLKAIASIPNKKELNFKFLAMGEDSGMLKILKHYVEENELEKYVTLIENPNDNTRDQLLEASEIFILASRLEGLGIVMLEAMAKGNAIISTTTEGGKFLIKEDNGLLYDFKDIELLREHIVRLIQDEALRNRIVRNNYEYAKQFVWSSTYIPYAKLLEKLAK